jgi:hypothetical protein
MHITARQVDSGRALDVPEFSACARMPFSVATVGLDVVILYRVPTCMEGWLQLQSRGLKIVVERLHK